MHHTAFFASIVLSKTTAAVCIVDACMRACVGGFSVNKIAAAATRRMVMMSPTHTSTTPVHSCRHGKRPRNKLKASSASSWRRAHNKNAPPVTLYLNARWGCFLCVRKQKRHHLPKRPSMVSNSNGIDGRAYLRSPFARTKCGCQRIDRCPDPRGRTYFQLSSLRTLYGHRGYYYVLFLYPHHKLFTRKRAH